MHPKTWLPTKRPILNALAAIGNTLIVIAFVIAICVALTLLKSPPPALTIPCSAEFDALVAAPYKRHTFDCSDKAEAYARILDAAGCTPLVFIVEPTPDATELHAVRSGPWKLRLENTLRHEDIYRRWKNPDAPIPETLYNLRTDPGEQKCVRRNHRDIVDRLRQLAQQAREDLGDSRTKTTGRNVRPIGKTTRE